MSLEGGGSAHRPGAQCAHRRGVCAVRAAVKIRMHLYYFTSSPAALSGPEIPCSAAQREKQIREAPLLNAALAGT